MGIVTLRRFRAVWSGLARTQKSRITIPRWFLPPNSGAIVLVLADVVARILIPPQDMPIGILTGIIGGLFFIGLMRWRQAGHD